MGHMQIILMVVFLKLRDKIWFYLFFFVDKVLVAQSCLPEVFFLKFHWSVEP